MHLSIKHAPSLEEDDRPVNPEQSPADMLVLSFTDSDLACMAQAYQKNDAMPSLRLTSLARLAHPLSVDLYMEQVASKAKIIVARLLGGYEWWQYGAEELGRIAREKNILLIMVPGDGREDPRLPALSTATPDRIAAVDQCLAAGGIANARVVLEYMATLCQGQPTSLPVPVIIPPASFYRMVAPKHVHGQVLILFYRAHYLAADIAPIDALLEALAERGLSARAFMVASLKDSESLALLREALKTHVPDVILDATAFSASATHEQAHPLADIDVPILQCALANVKYESWQSSLRGLAPADMAMHVVLPESDGRIFTRAISFKAESKRDDHLEYQRIIHQPEMDRIAYMADISAAWVALARKPAQEKRIGMILSDYPARPGRNAYAVGLDAPASALHIVQLLAGENYTVGEIPTEGGTLLSDMQSQKGRYSLEAYRLRFASLPPACQKALHDSWGVPENDPFFHNDAFHLPCARYGNMMIALQPDRCSQLDRKSSYHDTSLPPRHGYLAFYWWLRDEMQIDALLHIGTHGNLEWLPGKAVALSSSCWPELALGPVPVIYPYIVSDPGEAGQAKRRIAAVTLSHLTPPLIPVDLSPDLAALETLVDEYSSADGLDKRRMALLHTEIMHRAKRCGLPGTNLDSDDTSVMTALETHLCDIKEQRVGDGLHIFGDGEQAKSEAYYLIGALQGRFIPPSPGGSPSRGRLDVLPTGRNLITIDPRMIPTPTATIIGKRAAEEFMRRYAQDHGEWPKRIMLDVWGSATLRNGGDEIAQALCLMGINPVWEESSARISGFEILSKENVPWPRVDVSLRISGLFRDMFSHVMALFDDAVQAIAALDEEMGINPLAASVRGLQGEARRQATWRIFGSAPGAYGIGVTDRIDQGNWSHRHELGQAYLEASHFAYGRGADGKAEPGALKECIAAADALLHVQDQRETDVLSGADFADTEGGFAAAASLLGNAPALYHLDTSRPERIIARTLTEEISLTLQARALGKQWIAGQMRHGYAGAAALADVVDQLFAFAATSDAVTSAQFDAVCDAYLCDQSTQDFLAKHNPVALQAISERLQEAIRRGFWQPLRNSVMPLLDKLNGKPQREEAA